MYSSTGNSSTRSSGTCIYVIGGNLLAIDVLLYFSYNSVIFRAFLLPENSSKNAIFKWVLKVDLDQQTF